LSFADPHGIQSRVPYLGFALDCIYVQVAKAYENAESRAHVQEPSGALDLLQLDRYANQEPVSGAGIGHSAVVMGGLAGGNASADSASKHVLDIMLTDARSSRAVLLVGRTGALDQPLPTTEKQAFQQDGRPS